MSQNFYSELLLVPNDFYGNVQKFTGRINIVISPLFLSQLYVDKTIIGYKDTNLRVFFYVFKGTSNKVLFQILVINKQEVHVYRLMQNLNENSSS